VWMHGSDRRLSWRQHTFNGNASEIQYLRSAVRNLDRLKSCHSLVRTFSFLHFPSLIHFLHVDLTTRQFSHSADAQYTNETLLRHGFLGATPEKPTLAFSLELLEIYRQLRRVCPRFSLDALAKALCHLNRVRSLFSPAAIISEGVL
jgi:hypothetical protein